MTARAEHSRKRTRIQKQNEERIIEAALAEFAAYGFRGATIDQIARGAGMSKPNLLYYFPNKSALYVTVLEHILEDWLTPLTELDPDGDPRTEIWKYVEFKLEMSRRMPDASKVFATEILQGAPQIKPVLCGSLKELVDEKCRILQGWIDKGRLAPVVPHHLVFTIWATTQHYADFAVQVEAVLGEDVDRDTIFAQARENMKVLFLDGLVPK